MSVNGLYSSYNNDPIARKTIAGGYFAFTTTLCGIYGIILWNHAPREGLIARFGSYLNYGVIMVFVPVLLLIIGGWVVGTLIAFRCLRHWPLLIISLTFPTYIYYDDLRYFCWFHGFLVLFFTLLWLRYKAALTT